MHVVAACALCIAESASSLKRRSGWGGPRLGREGTAFFAPCRSSSPPTHIFFRQTDGIIWWFIIYLQMKRFFSLFFPFFKKKKKKSVWVTSLFYFLVFFFFPFLSFPFLPLLFSRVTPTLKGFPVEGGGGAVVACFATNFLFLRSPSNTHTHTKKKEKKKKRYDGIYRKTGGRRLTAQRQQMTWENFLLANINSSSVKKGVFSFSQARILICTSWRRRRKKISIASFIARHFPISKRDKKTKTIFFWLNYLPIMLYVLGMGNAYEVSYRGTIW